MERTKTHKEYLNELQILADKHAGLKELAESLIQEGEGIEDKLKHSNRIMAITESVNGVMSDLDKVEDEYYALLKEYKDRK